MNLGKAFKKVTRAVTNPISKAVKKVGKAVKKIGKGTVKAIKKPSGIAKSIGKAIKKAGKQTLAETSRAASNVSKVTKVVTDPITNTTKKILNPITKNLPKPIAEAINKSIDYTVNPVAAVLDPSAKILKKAGKGDVGGALTDLAHEAIRETVGPVNEAGIKTVFERDNQTRKHKDTLAGTDWGGHMTPDGTITVDQYPGITFANNQELIDYAIEQGDIDYANQVNDWYNENADSDLNIGGTNNGEPTTGAGSDLNTEEIGKKLASDEAFKDITAVAGISEGTKPEQAKELFKKMIGDAPESLSNVKFGNGATMANRMEDLKRKMEGDVEDTTTSASSYISNMSKGLLEGAETASGRSSSLGAAKSSVSNLANKMIGQKHLKSQVEAVEKRDEARSALVALKGEIASENIKAEDAYRKAKAKTAIGLTNVEESAKMQKVLEMRARRNSR